MKQKLKWEIQRLKTTQCLLKFIEDDKDVEILKRGANLYKGFKEKLQSVEDLQALNQTLIVKELKSNELQEARKKLINVSTFLLSHFFCYLLNDSCSILLARFSSNVVSLSCRALLIYQLDPKLV